MTPNKPCGSLIPNLITLAVAAALSACGGGGGTSSQDAAAVQQADSAATASAQAATAAQLTAATSAATSAQSKATEAKTAATAAATYATAAAQATTPSAAKTASDNASAESAKAAAAATAAASFLATARTLADATTDLTIKAQYAAALSAKTEADSAASAAAASALSAATAYAASVPAMDSVVSTINFGTTNMLAAATGYSAGLSETGDHTGTLVWEPVAGVRDNGAAGGNVHNWTGTGTATYVLNVRNATATAFGQVFKATTGFMVGAGMGPDELGAMATTPDPLPGLCSPAGSTPFQIRSLEVRAYSTDERIEIANPTAVPTTLRVPSYARLAVWKQDTCSGANWSGFMKGIIPFGIANVGLAGASGFYTGYAGAATLKGGVSQVGMFAGGDYQGARVGTATPPAVKGVSGDVYFNTNFTDRTVMFRTNRTNFDNVPDATLDIPPTRLAWDATAKLFKGSVTTAGGMTGTVSLGLYGPNADEAAGVIQLTGANGTYLATGFGSRNNVPDAAQHLAQRNLVPCATLAGATRSTCAD